MLVLIVEGLGKCLGILQVILNPLKYTVLSISKGLQFLSKSEETWKDALAMLARRGMQNKEREATF